MRLAAASGRKEAFLGEIRFPSCLYDGLKLKRVSVNDRVDRGRWRRACLDKGSIGEMLCKSELVG